MMVDKDLINKFFEGKASESEARKVLQWVESDKFEEDLRKLYRYYTHTNEGDKEWDELSQLRKLKTRLKAQNELNKKDNVLTHSFPSTQKSKFGLFFRIAASFLIMFAVGYAIIRFSDQPDQNLKETSSIVWIDKETSVGQKSTIYLEDGTRVILNANSSIKFPNVFAMDQRQIILEGEAFFEVKSDSLRPFIVKSANVITKAMGTSFNVNSYEEQQLISLVSGKVVVYTEDLSISEQFLSPGEQIRINNDDFVKSDFDTEIVTGWKEGKLIFKQADLAEVIHKLEMWYGVNVIIVNRPVVGKHYNGKFDNESLENVLRGIGYINDFTFKIEGKEVVIRFNE